MAGRPVRWTATRTTEAFQPAGQPRLRLRHRHLGWDDEQPGAEHGGLRRAERARPTRGGTSRSPRAKAEAPAEQRCEYTLEAEVADVNRQRIANRTEVHVHPAALYAGMRQRSRRASPRWGSPSRSRRWPSLPTASGRSAEVEVTVLRRDWKFDAEEDAPAAAGRR